MGSCFDKASNLILKFENVLKDEDQIKAFIKSYNEKNDQKIPSNYFDFLKDEQELHRGSLIEKLAKYGDASHYEFPIGFKNQINADMTYTGLRTAIISSVIL